MSGLTEEAEETEGVREIEKRWMIDYRDYGVFAGGVGEGMQARYRA